MTPDSRALPPHRLAQATAHPAFLAHLPSPTEARVHSDGNLCTSRGPGTALEYALALVGRLWGEDKADDVARPMVRNATEGFSA